MKGLSQGSSASDLFCSNFCKGKSSVLVRFSVLALLTVVLVGGASALEYRIIDELGDGSTDGSEIIGGDGSSDNIYHYSQEFCSSQDFEAEALTIYDVTSTADSSFSFEVYINQGTTDKNWDEGTKVVDGKSWSTGNLTASFSSNYQFNSGSCYEVEINTEQTDNDGAYDKLETGYDSSPSSDKANYERLPDGFSSSYYGHYIDIGFQIVSNQAPQFNSSSITPDPALIGENVSYSAEVYDSDGSVDYTNLTLEYGGSTVLSDAQRTGTTTPSWNDVYTPQDGNKWLNATLRVVDDAGAVTTTEINRYLADDAPEVNIVEPTNSTFWSYDVPLNVEASDSDSNPGETFTCTIDKDGSQVDSFTIEEGVNTSYSSSVRTDLGSHALDVSCTDPAGNTGTDTENYEVKAFNFSNVQGASETVETVSNSYSSDLKVGEMVENVTTTLAYEGTDVQENTATTTGIETFTPTLSYETPLVQNNATVNQWKLKIDYVIQDFNSGTESKNSETNNQSQTVNHGFYIQNSSTNPSDGEYIEDENFEHEINVYTETKKPSISGLNNYNRTGNTADASLNMEGEDSNIYIASQDVGLADSFNKSTFGTSTEFTVEFNGDSRTFSTAVEPVEVYKIILTDGTSNLDTAPALKFNTFYEGTEDPYATDLNMDLTVFNEEGEKSRRYSFQEKDSESHTFHLYPSWANYFVQTQEYEDQAEFDIIQYEPTTDGGNLRSYFFPKAQPIDDSVTEVPLQTINDTETSRIDYEITTSSGEQAEGIVCRADRKFPGTGEHKTVYMIRTGAQGNSQSFAEVNEIYYRHICFDGEEQIDTFGDQIMSNPMRLTLGEGQEDNQLDYYKKFDASCSVNETEIDCSYQSQTDELQRAELIVERKEVVKDIQVANKTSTSATGGLTATGLNTSENSYNYKVTGYYPDGIAPVLNTNTENLVGGMGAAGIMATMIIFLLVFAASSFNPFIGVMAGTITLLLSNLVDFILLTPAQRATLIGLTIVIALVINR